MRCLCLVVLFVSSMSLPAAEKITPSVTLHRGAVNGVEIIRRGQRMAVYGWPRTVRGKCELLLLTHHRRDVVAQARRLSKQAMVVIPAAEKALIESPEKFWDSFRTRRFHDYDQQSTKILSTGVKAKVHMKNSGIARFQDLSFQALETPGFTRGSITYLSKIDGKRIAFTGDLIYGDGKLFDLYSLQDAIPDAQIRGYHGYAGRLAQLITSLKKVAALKPDILIPVRGPAIDHPQESIGKLIRRVRAIYGNYLSTNALNWYFKEKRMTFCGKRVLGKNAEVQLKSYSLYQKSPDWIWEKGTSRLLISEKRRGFLLDCGNTRIIESVKQLIKQGLITKVDGIFVTHYHDDHTDAVQQASQEFNCPVYATKEYEDILQRPGAYHMPAMTANAIRDVTGVKSGHKMSWNEFDLTFYFYPGQAYYHGALLTEKKGSQSVFFIGDAFSPSGMDDYCLLNRNLIHDDGGYFRCLSQIRQLGKVWLVNEHIPYVFSYTNKELDYFTNRYRKRKKMLADLFPWDDPNYGIDEQWAVCYPYGQTRTAGEKVSVEVRITNHSPKKRTFKVTPKAPPGCAILDYQSKLTLAARKSGKLRFVFRGPKKAGTYLMTADIDSPGMHFRDWVEAMIIVK